MIRKTEAIVLSTRKYQESSLLVSLYTRESGKMDFLVKGYRSTRGKKRHSYFQPMSCIDVVIYVKETRGLQQITESTHKTIWRNLQSDPNKIALGLVGLEVFDRSVREHEQNLPMYEFLLEYLTDLDAHDSHLIHHFLHFLIHLTHFLGFLPHDDTAGADVPLLLDLKDGILMPAHPYPNVPPVFRDFLNSGHLSCRFLSLNNQEKKTIIRTMLDYYMHHVEGFRMPASLSIFREVFGG